MLPQSCFYLGKEFHFFSRVSHCQKLPTVTYFYLNEQYEDNFLVFFEYQVFKKKTRKSENYGYYIPFYYITNIISVLCDNLGGQRKNFIIKAFIPKIN